MHLVDEYALTALLPFNPKPGSLLRNMLRGCLLVSSGLGLANLVPRFTGARVVRTSFDVCTTLAGVVQLGGR